MEYVEIYKLKDDHSQEVIATCRLLNGQVVCEGDESFVSKLNTEGIFDYSSEQKDKIFPKDGRKFLEQLKFYFKSGYLNASDILIKN